MLGAAALPMGLLSCKGALRLDDLSGGALAFLHGVASGDPTADRVILWTRITPTTPTTPTPSDQAALDLGTLRIGFEVAEDATFKKPIRSGVATTDALQDFCVKVDAGALQPNRRYWYRFSTANQRSPVGTTRTLPTAHTSIQQLRLAVFSCSNWPFGYFHAYADAAKRSETIDLALHLGDYLYEYSEGRYPSGTDAVRHVKPAGETLTLSDYRQRYALYRTDKDLQAVHSRLPFICVWDDHEIANNAWRAGAQNHDQDEGDYVTRVQAAVQAYHEWMPIRSTSAPQQIYRSFQFGDLAALHMLDTRYIGRDQQLEHKNYVDAATEEMLYDDWEAAVRHPARSLLGNAQRRWLQQAVNKSQVRWQILGQQILMGKYNLPSPLVRRQIPFEEYLILARALELQAKQPNAPELAALRRAHPQLLRDQQKIKHIKEARPLLINPDAWDGYHREREHVFGMMAAADTGFIALAGDTHNAWASYLRRDNDQVVGAEFGGQSVTSPGLENFLNLNTEQAEQFEQAMQGMVSDLKYINARDRGYMMVTITPDEAEAEWIYVTSVREPDYQILKGRGHRTTFSRQTQRFK